MAFQPHPAVFTFPSSTPEEFEELFKLVMDEYEKTPEGRKKALDVLARSLKQGIVSKTPGVQSRAAVFLDLCEKDGFDVQGVRQLLFS